MKIYCFDGDFYLNEFYGTELDNTYPAEIPVMTRRFLNSTPIKKTREMKAGETVLLLVDVHEKNKHKYTCICSDKVLEQLRKDAEDWWEFEASLISPEEAADLVGNFDLFRALDGEIFQV